MIDISDLQRLKIENEIEEITDEEEQRRVLAILDCFGVEAILEKKEVFLENSGETISFWGIEGINDLDALFTVFTLGVIVSLYDSGL